jgi:hypothetical protein
MPAIVYRVATETPTGWRWHCPWCHGEAIDSAPSWAAAVDQLMDTHAPQCPPYQHWFALYAVLERRAARRRRRARTARTTKDT